MGGLVMHLQVTLDGSAADKEEGVEWAMPQFDAEFIKRGVELLNSAGLHAMGGVTGEGLAAYWSDEAGINDRDKPFAGPFNAGPKIIFSKSLKTVDWNNATIFRGDAIEELKRLKQEPGDMILIHGGIRFIQSLTDARLIDEYEITVHPVAIREGRSLFGDLTKDLKLKLVDSQAFPAGAVRMNYRLA